MSSCKSIVSVVTQIVRAFVAREGVLPDTVYLVPSDYWAWVGSFGPEMKVFLLGDAELIFPVDSGNDVLENVDRAPVSAEVALDVLENVNRFENVQFVFPIVKKLKP